MGNVINSFQLFEGGMGIDLGGRQAFMPQQLLHTLQSCLIVEHRRGECMPQHVRRVLLEGGDHGKEFGNFLSHLVPVHPLAL